MVNISVFDNHKLFKLLLYCNKEKVGLKTDVLKAVSVDNWHSKLPSDLMYVIIKVEINTDSVSVKFSYYCQ